MMVFFLARCALSAFLIGLFQGLVSGQRQVSQPPFQRTRPKRDAPQPPLETLDGVEQVYSKTGDAGQGGARAKTASDKTARDAKTAKDDRTAKTASVAVVGGI